MAFSDEDEAHLRLAWEKIGPSWAQHCPDAMYKMFMTFPSTKAYFSSFDMNSGSPQIQAHGRKVAGALNKAVEHVDDMSAVLSVLSDLHAYQLCVDPVNFQLLKHSLLGSQHS